MEIFHRILQTAIEGGASDVHLKVNSPVVFRINRQLIAIEAPLPTAEWMENVLKQMVPPHARQKLDEHREVDFSYWAPGVGRFRTNAFQQRGQFCLAMRHVKTKVPSFEELGLMEAVRKIAESPRGIVLIAGSTGCGKSTTLAAMVEHINTNFKKHLITLEDPIEYQIPGINQSQVNAEINYTFASGLRSILRQDPDVVMIGEIRDKETAEMAVHAALTGHVVLSTLHTNDSAGAIPRLIDMGIEPFLLNSSLNLILAQRLARRICDSCKEEISPTPDQLKLVQDELAKMSKSEKTKIGNKIKLYKGKGCKDCGDTGYKGRIGIYEVLEVDKKIKDMVAHEASSAEIEESAVANGMTTMVQDGILKAISGQTTIEEVWRVTKE